MTFAAGAAARFHDAARKDVRAVAGRGRRTRGRVLLGGALLLAAWVAAQAAQAGQAAPTDIVIDLAGLPTIPARGEFALTPRLMVQLALARNADASYARLASEVSGHLAHAESGLFEVVAYGGVRHEDRKRKRSAQDIGGNSVLSPQFRELVLDENVYQAEMGVRRRLAIGGELSLSYKLGARNNNLIAVSNAERRDTEYDGALALTFRQPLLRGFGSTAVEADRRIAELEWAITRQQYKQQLLRSASEALTAYWQLHRAWETLRMRREAVQRAEAALRDIEARIGGGRLPPRGALEARSALTARRAEALRAEQGLSEAESRIKSLLNLGDDDYRDLRPRPASAPPAGGLPVAVDGDRLERALSRWPGMRIAELKRQQGGVRLDFAANQKRPQLDLTASCSSTSLSYRRSDAADDPLRGDYPDCYVGLSLEMPLQGNVRASSQHLAQRARMSQSDIEIQAVRTTLTNDLHLRARQLERVRQEVAEYRRDVELRAQLLASERTQFELGLSRLSQVIARENEWAAAREALLDAEARLALAEVALRVADGSLFDEYGVDWREG